MFGSSLGGPTPARLLFAAPRGSQFHFDGMEYGNVREWGFFAFSWPWVKTLVNTVFVLKVARRRHSLSREYGPQRVIMISSSSQGFHSLEGAVGGGEDRC